VWRIPPPLFAGSGVINQVFTSDTLIGDLYTFLGSPSGPQEVTLTVDGADIGDVRITGSFAGGSTFDIICINGGRVVGLGGEGGDGGNDNGATGTSGSFGSNGGHALSITGFTVNLDIDDGFLLGGGGGGGGGGYSSTNNSPGGGGGGGQGFGTGISGGAAGTPTGTPVANPGGDGSKSGPGTGGNGGDTTAPGNAGGNGGSWGYGGAIGEFPTTAPSNFGGAGGSAGSAMVGSGTLVFSGTKSQTTLEAENRIIGEIGGYINIPGFLSNGVGGDNNSKTCGFDFQNDTGGTLTLIRSGGTPPSSNTNRTDSWEIGNLNNADYELAALSGMRDGTWDASAAADGTWTVLTTADLIWSITTTGNDAVTQMFAIRRAGDTSGNYLATGKLSVSLSDLS
jgi:hypothetical protein